MLKKTVCLLVFVNILNFELPAQQAGNEKKIDLSAVIASLDKAAPLEYVFIWISRTHIGTHTSKNGFFKLSIPAKYQNDTLVFSLLSYQTLKVPVQAIYRKMDTIFMAEKFIYLDQIQVPGKKPN